MGKDLPGHLEQAGFADIQVSASFEVFSGTERLKLFYDLGEEWYFTSEVETPAEQYGASSAGMFAEIKSARDQWYKSTGAMAAFALGEAVAVKP